MGGGATERLVQDATRPVMRRHCNNVRIHPYRRRVTQDLCRLTAGAGELSRSSSTTTVSTYGWLHIAWLSTVVVCILWSHSKSIGVYHTRGPHTDTTMSPHSASTSMGAPCEGLPPDLTGVRRVVCNSVVTHDDCSVCTLYSHAQENVITL